MTVIPTASTQQAESSTVKLAAYAQAIQICECSFWGVTNAGCDAGQNCRDIWTKNQRDEVAFYLAEAQEEIERELGYFIGQRWVTDERHKYSAPVVARWGHIIAGGIQGTTTIASGAALDDSTDPETVGPIATTVTDENEIHVFHPGSDVEIDPSSITLSGGFVTIEIPRCRLVELADADNPDTGLDYADDANFETEVDVKRIYNDTTTQAVLVRNSCGSDCSESESSACIQVRYSNIGSLYVPLASSGLCGCADFVELNYYAGIDMTKQARDTIIRLAHSKMPRNPCSCSPIAEFWRRDRFTPEVLSAERLNCPFGTSDGAWIAWRWTQAMRLARGATL